MEGGRAVYFAFMSDLVVSIDSFEIDNQGVSIEYVLGVGWGSVNGIPFGPALMLFELGGIKAM